MRYVPVSSVIALTFAKLAGSKLAREIRTTAVGGNCKVMAGFSCFACHCSAARSLASNSLKRQRHALANADAHRRKRALAAALFQAMHCRQREPRTGHAERMTKRDGAAVRIDVLSVIGDPKLPQARQSLRSEGLIELDEIEVSDPEAKPLHQFAGRGDRT